MISNNHLWGFLLSSLMGALSTCHASTSSTLDSRFGVGPQRPRVICLNNDRKNADFSQRYIPFPPLRSRPPWPNSAYIGNASTSSEAPTLEPFQGSCISLTIRNPSMMVPSSDHTKDIQKSHNSRHRSVGAKNSKIFFRPRQAF